MIQYTLLMTSGVLGVGVYFKIASIFKNLVIHPEKRNYEQVLEEEIKKGNIPEGYITRASKEYDMKSNRGYNLYAHYYKANKPSSLYLIYNHGYNYPYYSAFKYLPMLLEKNINVFIPDHVGCGKSGDGPITFGGYEHEDSMKWIDTILKIAKEEGQDKPIIGVMGESMGAATSLLMAAKDKRLSYCIADCSYTSWNDILKYCCKVEYPTLLRLTIPGVKWLIKRETGINIKDVDMIKASQNINIPTLLIHGEEDDYVPVYMARALKEANKKAELFIQPGAKHAASICVDEQAYKSKVYSFLKKNDIIQK